MYCSQCGSKMGDNAAVCQACGAARQPANQARTNQAVTDSAISEMNDPAHSGDFAPAGGSTLLPPGTTLASGAYEIDQPLGRGASAITYRAEDRRESRPAVVKEFFPTGCERHGLAVAPGYGWDDAAFADSRQQFLQEGQRLAGRQHPNIVRVLNAFEENSTAYLVMEFIQGETLRDLVRQTGPLSENDALDCIRQAASALAAVHEMGILHLDIKPTNIMLTNDGRVIIVSFGAVKRYVASATQTDAVSLTPGYAPLEQYALQATRGQYTDVYALAGALYFLLTGTPPPPATERLQGTGLPDIRVLCPDVSERTVHAVTHGMAMNAADRPQSVVAFMSELGVQMTSAAAQNAAPGVDAPSQSNLAADPRASEGERYAGRSPGQLAPAAFSAEALAALDTSPLQDESLPIGTETTGPPSIGAETIGAEATGTEATGAEMAGPRAPAPASFGAAIPGPESSVHGFPVRESDGPVAPAVSDTDRTTISRGPGRAIPLHRVGSGTRPGRAAWLLVPAAICCAIAAVLLSRSHNQTAVNYGSIGRRAPVAVAERPAASGSAPAVPTAAGPTGATPATPSAQGAGSAAPAAAASARKQALEVRQAHRRMEHERLVRERAAKAREMRVQAAKDRAAHDLAAQNRTTPAVKASAGALSPPAGASIPAVAAANSVQIARVGYQAPGLGFRIDRPAGWTPEATVEAGMTRTWFHSPEGRTTIMVESDPGQAAVYPEQTWRWQDAKFRKEYGSAYRLLGVQRGTLEGHPAVAWSFLLQPGQTTYRKVDILMYRGGHGYAILFSAPADEFASFQSLFRQIADSFRFTEV